MKLSVLEAGIKLDGPRWPKPFEVSLLVRLYRPRRAGDIDGPLKTLLDVLQGIVFENDDQVARLEVYRHDDKARPRVEIEVTELATNQPAQPAQAALFEVLPTDPTAEERIGELLREKRESESLSQRLRRLARPAHVNHRSDDEPPF